MKQLEIISPKRTNVADRGWDGFFPYYAGFPLEFAETILRSAELPQNSIVLDPWNGSGTTTHAAARLGFTSIGQDINPAMAVIGKARSLARSEADSLSPMLQAILDTAQSVELSPQDPLLVWFGDITANYIRSVEQSIRTHLVGGLSGSGSGCNSVANLSKFAATFYVALFAVCRELAADFKCSNPTWLRMPKQGERRANAPRSKIAKHLNFYIESMAHALASSGLPSSLGDVHISVQDSTSAEFGIKCDFVLTSPPYCTRIDYAAATRIELAVLAPLLETDHSTLRARMLGSTIAPKQSPAIDAWGDSCLRFLDQVRQHTSKASAGYYLRTHQDYFDKLYRSLGRLSGSMQANGRAVMVVQDSHYKEIHNDLPTYVIEMASYWGLELTQRVDFPANRSMARINPGTRAYSRKPGATEAVLCFHKPN